MGTYNFDKITERRGSGALKTDGIEERFGNASLIPLWVADMDFETPDFIVEAIRRRAAHPVFGYTMVPDEYWTAIVDWIAIHHSWKVERSWLRYIPGIVKGIGMAINVFVAQDEKVIIQPPVYHPFRLVPMGNDRQVVYNPLQRDDEGRYHMDFNNLELVADEKCRMLLLSNPHNPGGIVWDRDTLECLADFCYEKGIIVVSDEIHCDMTLWDNRHIPFASVSDKASACSITFGAPSKTFNIAGIVSSYAIVPDEVLRRKFFTWLLANELDSPDIFAPIATIAAFTKGEVWRQEMLAYVEDNVDLVIDYCARYIPRLKPLRPQASFLVWIDCRQLGLSHSALVDLFVRKARLALNDGMMFGKEGEGFMRMNVATPRSILQRALDQLREAVESI